MTAFFITTLCGSLLLLAVAVIIGLGLHSGEMRGKGIFAERRILTPFQIFLIIFFFAAIIAYYPVSYIENGAGGLRNILNSILLAFLNVMRMFTLNGEYDGVTEALAQASGMPDGLTSVYSVYMALIYLAAPVMAAGFILSLFKEISALIKYYLYPKADLYLISELNERSLALAEDIRRQKKGRKLIVFTDVFEQNEERDFELIGRAKRLGVLLLKRDITELGFRSLYRNCQRKVYLLGEDEDENLRQALTLIHRFRGSRIEGPRLQLYVFSRNTESEALLNSADGGEIKVRRINEFRSLAMSEMLENPVFPPREEGEVGKICIAIIGLGRYGTELLKTVCWCTQMPGYELSVHIFDKDNAEDRMLASVPELIKKAKEKLAGDAEYELNFHNNTDVMGSEFLKTISAIDGLTRVYVCLGDDETNVDIAMRVRMELGRAVQERGGRVPPIYSIVYSASKTETVAMQENGLINMRGEPYGITFIGSVKKRYSLENIEQPDLERVAFSLHMSWANTQPDDIKEKMAKQFERYEYFRRSSMAGAMYRRLRADLGIVKRSESEDLPKEEREANIRYNDILREYEHRRWNTFIRADGYVRSPVRDDIAKTHPLLESYHLLPPDEKKKDDF